MYMLHYHQSFGKMLNQMYILLPVIPCYEVFPILNIVIKSLIPRPLSCLEWSDILFEAY